MITPDEFRRLMKRMDDHQNEGEQFADLFEFLDFVPPKLTCERPNMEGDPCRAPARWLFYCIRCHDLGLFPMAAAACDRCRDSLMLRTRPTECARCRRAWMAGEMFKWIELEAAK